MEKFIKDKEQTKRRLIAAVGEILKSDGYHSLGVNRVARQAGVNKKLIYRYFGSLNYLIETYIIENDYWMVFTNRMQDMIKQESFSDMQEMIAGILQNQFKFFLSEPEMQRLILWELSSKEPLLKSIHQARESTGQQLLEMTDGHFKGGNVNFRAVAALLVGGIYYTILHIQNNGGLFCDLDLHTETGQNEILKAIEQIIHWSFEKV
jgi:AcrR family transcriptional regulator